MRIDEQTFGGVDSFIVLNQSFQDAGERTAVGAVADALLQAIYKNKSKYWEAYDRSIDGLIASYQPDLTWGQDQIDLYSSVKKWPDKFRSALHRAFVRLMPYSEESPYGTRPESQMRADYEAIGQESGINPDLVEQLHHLMWHGRKATGSFLPFEKRKEVLGTWDLYAANVVKIIDGIDLSLKRMPDKIAKMVRERGEFIIAFDDSKATDKDYKFAEKKAVEYAKKKKLMAKTARSIGRKEKESGQYRGNNQMVYFVAEAFQKTIPHEIGHMLHDWLIADLDERNPHLHRFFEQIVREAVKVSKTFDEFIDKINLTLGWMRLDDTHRAIEHVVSNWGKEYVDKAFEDNKTRLLEQTKLAGLLADELIRDNKNLLGSWGEVWAEAFAAVIMGERSKMTKDLLGAGNASGLMIALVNRLLEIGTKGEGTEHSIAPLIESLKQFVVS